MEPGNLPEKIQNNDSENDPGSQKKNGEDIRNVYQRPGRTKEQTEMSNTVEWINSRTKAEDWISDLEVRMVEITAANIIVTRLEKKNDTLSYDKALNTPTFTL